MRPPGEMREAEVGLRQTPSSGCGLTGTLGSFLVGAGREREAVRAPPLPRAREFDLVLVAMGSRYPRGVSLPG